MSGNMLVFRVCGSNKDRKSVVLGKGGDIGVTGVQTCALPILISREREVRNYARCQNEACAVVIGPLRLQLDRATDDRAAGGLDERRPAGSSGIEDEREHARVPRLRLEQRSEERRVG